MGNKKRQGGGIKTRLATIIALTTIIAGCATAPEDNTAVLPDQQPIIIVKKSAVEPIKIATYQYVKTLGYTETEDFDKNPDTLLFTKPMGSSQGQLPQYSYDSKIWIKFTSAKNNTTQIEIYNYSERLIIRQETDNDMRNISDFIKNQS